MIHAKLVQPRIFSNNSERVPEQINRAQDIGGDLTLTQEKLYEIGRDGKLGVRKETPSLAYPLTQYEYGSMAFFYALANREDPGTGDDHFVDLDDLKTTMSDITAYLTDDDNTFKGTMWFPKLRVNGFKIDIGDPAAAVKRSFDLIGEDFKILPETYFSYATGTAVGATLEITLSPEAVEYGTGLFIFRVLRIRAGVVSYLTADWSYSDVTKKVTIVNCEAGDVVKAYYPSATAYTDLWTDNDSDPDALYAEDCEISMKVGTGDAARIYRLQSVGIDVAFTRTDYKEIGNSEIVQTGVTAKTVTISLNRYNEGFSLEEILIDDTNYSFDKEVYIDPREFADNIQVQVKIYKMVAGVRTFAIGYLATELSPTALSSSQAVEEYGQLNNTLEGDACKVSDDVDEIAFV